MTNDHTASSQQQKLTQQVNLMTTLKIDVVSYYKRFYHNPLQRESQSPYILSMFGITNAEKILIKKYCLTFAVSTYFYSMIIFTLFL